MQIAFLQGKHKGMYIDVHDRSAHAVGKAFTGHPEKDLRSKDFLGRGATSVYKQAANSRAQKLPCCDECCYTRFFRLIKGAKLLYSSPTPSARKFYSANMGRLPHTPR